MTRRKKPKRRYFHIGKGIPKTDEQRTSFQGAPNSNLDTYEKSTGLFHSRRKYGKDGHAIKDLDAADEHKSFDHVHDISGTHRSSTERLPNKKERREIRKAKRKRRFYK